MASRIFFPDLGLAVLSVAMPPKVKWIEIVLFPFFSWPYQIFFSPLDWFADVERGRFFPRWKSICPTSACLRALRQLSEYYVAQRRMLFLTVASSEIGTLIFPPLVSSLESDPPGSSNLPCDAIPPKFSGKAGPRPPP